MKKVLFVGGLYCGNNFKTHIINVFGKMKCDIRYAECKEISQDDIDWCDIVIGYSFAIQYLIRCSLINKKIILLSPLLNDGKITEWLIDKAGKYVRWRKKFSIEVKAVFYFFGCNKMTGSLWHEDMIKWLDKYGTKEKIQNINPRDEWIILEGKSPLCKIDKKRIDGQIYDYNNEKKLCNHFINLDNDYEFIKNWL